MYYTIYQHSVSKTKEAAGSEGSLTHLLLDATGLDITREETFSRHSRNSPQPKMSNGFAKRTLLGQRCCWQTENHPGKVRQGNKNEMNEFNSVTMAETTKY